MHLKLREGNKTHLSHFHHLVSAYENTPETVKWLEETLLGAISVAKATGESQIVDQDSSEHIFIVHPSGTIALYREVGSYEVVENETTR